jgi:hypothetical protein
MVHHYSIQRDAAYNCIERADDARRKLLEEKVLEFCGVLQAEKNGEHSGVKWDVLDVCFETVGTVDRRLGKHMVVGSWGGLLVWPLRGPTQGSKHSASG